MVRYGTVRYGMVWYGTYGMVWYGMAWYGKHPKLAGTGPLATATEHLEGIADTGDPLDLYADAPYNWAHGDVHEDIITLHLSGLLSAKQKATGGVRPLVASSVHRRIAMRAILAVHKEALIELLGQEQYGMGERAAVEKMPRFVEPAVHEHAENMVMALDMINAFNSMNYEPHTHHGRSGTQIPQTP